MKKKADKKKEEKSLSKLEAEVAVSNPSFVKWLRSKDKRKNG